MHRSSALGENDNREGGTREGRGGAGRDSSKMINATHRSLSKAGRRCGLANPSSTAQGDKQAEANPLF